MQSMDELDSIRLVQRAEYAGVQGIRKMEHCARFTAVKDRVTTKTRKHLVQELDTSGASITCRRGCSHCCHHYITASIAEGLVIVDFLYRNEKTLEQFLKTYYKWREKAGGTCVGLDQLRALARLSGTPVESYRTSVSSTHREYAKMAVPCPFLTNSNDCAIYAVRPLCCSIHASTDTPERCSPDSPQTPRSCDVLPSDNDMARLVSFWPSDFSTISLTMPTLVYNLLTKGTEFLRELTE